MNSIVQHAPSAQQAFSNICNDTKLIPAILLDLVHLLDQEVHQGQIVLVVLVIQHLLFDQWNQVDLEVHQDQVHQGSQLFQSLLCHLSHQESHQGQEHQWSLERRSFLSTVCHSNTFNCSKDSRSSEHLIFSKGINVTS